MGFNIGNFIDDVGGAIGDVAELGFDTFENKADLEAAKIQRINTNNQIAAAQATAKLQADKENRELMKKFLLWGFGLLALIAVLKTLSSMGFIKPPK